MAAPSSTIEPGTIVPATCAGCGTVTSAYATETGRVIDVDLPAVNRRGVWFHAADECWGRITLEGGDAP